MLFTSCMSRMLPYPVLQQYIAGEFDSSENLEWDGKNNEKLEQIPQ